jgi:hypothetical protein
MMEEFYGKEVGRFYFVPSPFMVQTAPHVELDGEAFKVISRVKNRNTH